MNEERLFFELLDRYVVSDRLRFRVGERDIVVGRGADRRPAATVRVNDPRFFERVLADGSLGMGEAFMDGDFHVEEGSLTDFLTVLVRSRIGERIQERKSLRMRVRLLLVRLRAKLRGRRGNIGVHYDFDDDSLFEAFLDPRMVYSCGYVRDPEGTVEQFQLDKLERICQKLRLEPGHRLVDIGCGYGGMLIYAAQNCGVTGKGVTIGRRHYERAKRNVADAGLADRIEIELASYETLRGPFDRVVSLGMMEHLSRREYGRLARLVADILEPSGMGFFQFIGCTTPRNDHDPFIQKYILPDSNQPKLSEFVAQLGRHDMAVLDVENGVRHYAYTLREWVRNFKRNAPGLDQSRFDERFQRMWLYYLEGAAATAFASAAGLYQILFAKNYPPPMPIQRV